VRKLGCGIRFSFFSRGSLRVLPAPIILFESRLAYYVLTSRWVSSVLISCTRGKSSIVSQSIFLPYRDRWINARISLRTWLELFKCSGKF
jgi:hypothetical protein